MNCEQIMQRAEVAAAMAEGETVQYRDIDNGIDWTDYRGSLGTAGWFLTQLQWRKKPKPLECWVWVPETELDKPWEYTYLSRRENEPLIPVGVPSDGGRWVRMVEPSE